MLSYYLANLFLPFAVVSWFLLSLAAAGYAEVKGRNSLAGFFAALLLSPFFGFIIVAGLADRKSSAKDAALAMASTRKCPQCAERIKAEAVICRFCQSPQTPVEVVASAGSPVIPKEDTTFKIVMGLVVIGVVAVVVALLKGMG